MSKTALSLLSVSGMVAIGGRVSLVATQPLDVAEVAA